MSSNRQGLRRNVEIPTRYENSDVNTCQKAVKVTSACNSGSVKEAQGKKVNNVVLCQENMKSGVIEE